MLLTAAILAAMALGAQAAAPDDWENREKLIGKWQAEETGAGSPGAAWILEHAGDAIRVTQVAGGKTLVQCECALGKECDVSGPGDRAKVSMYYNGPRLIQIETKGSHVTKRRFTAVDEGNALEVESIPLVPAGKTERARFRRQE